MSKFNKLSTRFQQQPKDFTWSELKTLLNKFGFKEITNSGSRRKFYHEKSSCLINLHEPHPGKILKAYAMKNILTKLQESELI